MALLLIITVCGLLMLGYPVAFTLAGTALIFAGIGILVDPSIIGKVGLIPLRLFGILDKSLLIAIPLFIFMGVMLERSKIAERLLDTMALLFGPMRGGLGISVILVGMLLAASTGIVGATVVTMGLISLPTMTKRGYDPQVATGIICASGTLGQIIPPSIVLIILSDVLATAATTAKSSLPFDQASQIPSVSITDLFIGAIIPGLLLVGCYIIYIIFIALSKPEKVPAIPKSERSQSSKKDLFIKTLTVLLPPIILILFVLGSILTGLASPTEAAAVGAVGATLLAIFSRKFNGKILGDVSRSTMDTTSMVMMILIGSTIFSLVFRLLGGDAMVSDFLKGLPGNEYSALLFVMLLIFALGFILDFFEITLIVIPIVGPILLAMGFHPVWLGILIAVNLQTSFLTPPFGFSLFYLRSVVPKSISTGQIYKGVIPFIVIQVLVLALIIFWKDLATWLPELADQARKANR